MTAGARNRAMDLLRGVVMVLMALDHARDFFGGFSSRPTDLARTTPALFATRWITHFCAPVFVLLAGSAAYLHGEKLGARGALARFLVSRGAWLIALELTVIRFAWTFDPTYHYAILQVIWAIGVSMIALGVLVFLPLPMIASIGAALVLGHDAFDRVRDTAHADRLWHLLHVPGSISFGPTFRVFVLYPLVPWIGVMALGYALGAWLARGPAESRTRVLGTGVALIVLFVLLRASNLYGDPRPWASQRTAVFTLLAFLNCEKYPPSLLYLCMTLGPALVFLAGAGSRMPDRFAAPLVVYGRVPLFFYVAHLYALHTIAAIAFLATHRLDDLVRVRRDGLGWSLPSIYAIWIAVVVALYPACRWFAALKERRRSWWLSYL